MTRKRWQQIEHLLDEVLARPEEARAAFLDEACADDTALRLEVDVLLAAEAATPDFLEADAAAFAGPALEDPPETAVAGRRVGPYRLLREVGHGGMGVVYLAERDEVGRQVALKLVRGGLADPGATDRFLFEQRVLARLEHPHIARLYDVGVTADRTPYFAMEYVEGQALDAYCDAHHVGIEARLRLFEAVGQAVQHAHQHFVVHRDLKPSNILVTEDEAGRPQVKLLDFGIAKVLADTEEGLPAQTLTAAGRRLLTPAYAAPEQIRGEAATAATDVYSLGVVLYELLTGQRPYEVTGPGAAQAALTQEPKRPSTAVSSDTSTTTETAEARATTAEGLRRRLRGDLDVICLKALQKEPERRYASAEAFVEDIKRHLAGLPVTARPDTASYSLQKFVHRHRTGVAVAAVVVVLLALVVGFYTVQVQQERDAAQREAKKAREVTAFMVDLFNASDPSSTRGDTLIATDLLERGVQRATALDGQPAVQGQMLDAMGLAYRGLGLYSTADTLLQKALVVWQQEHEGPSLEALRTQWSRAVIMDHRGDYAAAESLYQQIIATYRELQGANLELGQILRSYGESLTAASDYENAEARLQEAMSLAQTFGEEDPLELAKVQNALGGLYLRVGEYNRAQPLLEDAIEAREQGLGVHTDVAISLSHLASVEERLGNLERGEALYRRSLEMNRTIYGDAHFRIGIALNNVGLNLQRQGRYEEAEALYQEALEVKRKTMGDEHASIAVQLYNIATLLHLKGDYDRAEPLFRQVIARDIKSFGVEHPEVGVDQMKLATLLSDKGDYQASAAEFSAALALLRRTLPETHPRIGETLDGLGVLLIRTNDYEEAETALLEALTIRRDRLGNSHSDTRKTLQHLTDLYEAWDQPAKAAEYRAVLDEEG